MVARSWPTTPRGSARSPRRRRAVGVPWLLVHGDADELVPLQDSLDAASAAGGRPDLVVLPGVDHRFTGALPPVSDAVVPWLRRATWSQPLA